MSKLLVTSFTIVIDSREQEPYNFARVRSMDGNEPLGITE